MLYATVKIDLVRLADVLENRFRLVALLRREDLVGFYPSNNTLFMDRRPRPLRSRLTSSGNAQRALDPLQLLRVHEAWMRRVSNVDALGRELPHHVLASEAVPDGTDPLGAHDLAQVLDELLDQRLRSLDAVVLDPAGEVEVGGPVQRDGVAEEYVGHVGQVAVRSELVGD